MTDNYLPKFVAGSEKQQQWANALRFKFMEVALDNFPDDELRDLYLVRVFPTWWIDHRDDLLNLKGAAKHIKSVKTAVTKAGSVEAVVDAQLLAAEKRKMKAEARAKELAEEEEAAIDFSLLEEIESDRGYRPF